MAERELIMKTLLLAFFLCLVTALYGQDAKKNEIKPKVTFIELGSVTCIPCRQMEPVLKSVRAKYGSQINVLFYDIKKEDQKKYSEQYKVKLIPTQVFLDESGKEFYRHQGFFPAKEIDKVLIGKGLKPANGK